MRSILFPLCIALAVPATIAAQQAPAPAPADTAGAIELSQAEILPEMKNLAEAQRLILELYPPALRNAGVAGTAKVRFVLSAAGVPAAALVAESSGNAQLDAAALRAVEAMRFEPAKRGGAPVAAWVTLPISFVAAPSASATGAEGPADSAFVAEQLRRAVGLEGVDQPPSLVDAAAVVSLIESHYPRSLAAAGVSGTVVVRVVVDAHGRPLAPWAPASSGYAELDRAALEAVRALRFVPAMRGGSPHPVRVDLPVTFVAPAGAAVALGPDPAGAPAAIRMDEADEPARLRDASVVTRAAARLHPAPLRAAGVGGTTTVRFVVDERGSPAAARVAVSSGHEELDRAALRVVEETRFEPARRGRGRVAAWMNLAVPFAPAAAESPERRLLGAAPDSLGIYELAQVDRLPELRNATEVSREITRGARELVERGAEGRATLELVVDREGKVSEVKVVESTHPGFGTNALRVAANMRFSPARLKGEAVPVRVLIPLTTGQVVRGEIRVEERTIPSTPSWLPADVRMVPFPRTTEGHRGSP